MTKDNEKAEIRNAFITAVFNSKTRSSLGTQALGLEDGMWIRMKPSIIQREMTSSCYTA